MQFENSGYFIEDETYAGLEEEKRKRLQDLDVMAKTCVYRCHECVDCHKKSEEGVSCAGGQLQLEILNAEEKAGAKTAPMKSEALRTDPSKPKHPLLVSIHSMFSNRRDKRSSLADAWFEAGGYGEPLYIPPESE